MRLARKRRPAKAEVALARLASVVGDFVVAQWMAEARVEAAVKTAKAKEGTCRARDAGGTGCKEKREERDMNTYKRVPKGLKRRRIWLLWREEKGRKVPYYVDGSRRAGTLDEPEDRKQLVSFEDALAKLERRRGKSNAYSGLGIALGPDGEGKVISGIDLDDCMDETGEITPLANEVLKASDDTYCEVSPSGRGLKLFGIGDIGTLTDHKNRIEIYSGKRFFAVTAEPSVPFAGCCGG